MLYEFAIDPRILTRWETYRDLVHDCGAEHGRLISNFPERWKKMVWEAVTANPHRTPLDAERIQFDLQHRVQAKLTPSCRRYDFNQPDWLAQAERENTTRPFRAIVSGENPRKAKAVIIAAEIDKEDDDCLWKVKRETKIARTPQEIAEIARLLLSISKHIRLVDYNFAPDALRYTRSLKQILAVLTDVNPAVRLVEIHVKYKTAPDYFKEECERQWLNIVPRYLELNIFRWKQKKGGEELHRRFILTEKGGIWYDVGLDAGNDGEQTDVGLLTEDSRKKWWQNYERDPRDPAGNRTPTTFELIDAIAFKAGICEALPLP